MWLWPLTMPTQNVLMLLMLMLSNLSRFWSWVVTILKLKFGQDFEVNFWSRLWDWDLVKLLKFSWSLVEILKLNFDQLVQWIKSVYPYKSTQPLVCLWQCFFYIGVAWEGANYAWENKVHLWKSQTCNVYEQTNKAKNGFMETRIQYSGWLFAQRYCQWT